MTDELLPCPFCGGQAEMLTAKSMHGGDLYGVMCNCCAGRTDVFDTEAEAVAAWNTRAERPCHPKFNGTWFICNVCGNSLDRFGVRTTQRLDGTTIRKIAEPPNYCPNCGAKVIGG